MNLRKRLHSLRFIANFTCKDRFHIQLLLSLPITNSHLMHRLLIPGMIVFATLGACKEQPPVEPELPTLQVSDENISEDTDTEAVFTLTLSAAFTETVKVKYYTVDGSAQSGPDYEGKEGEINFSPGQLTAEVAVKLVNDTLKEQAESFELVLFGAENAKLVKSRGVGGIREADTGRLRDAEGFLSPESYPDFVLAWSDEFSGTEMDPTVYTFEQGNNNGWGNQELQIYGSDNEFFEDGKLVIEARKGGTEASPLYTSARIITKGKKEFKYGRIDIRAKLPQGQGVWPALWMLGKNIDQAGWPACGEIDIMELIGSAPSTVHGTVHWGTSPAVHKYKGSSVNISPAKFADEFHIFSIYWRENALYWYIDDQLFYKITSNEMEGQPWPFNQEHFFLYNIAVGGQWPGYPDASTVFPQRMTIDYVRVFQH